MKTVTTVELSVFERITPLVSGYLEAYASTDPVVSREYRFDKYTTSIKTPYEQIARDLVAKDSDVFAFSAYVWNMGLVEPLAKLIRAEKPAADVILGGPQVMHHGLRYLDPHDEKTSICNGEGEVTFTEYLRALTEPSRDLSAVAGLSYYRDGELVNTGDRARIKDLDTIPSPFLSGLIAPEYSISIIETNRGCPYHCGFCFWGAATNDRVYRFDEERVRDELTWMSNNGTLFLYIADANWGMLARDVEFSEHIARLARETRLPNVVYFSSAKNKPHAVTKITGIFQEAGLVTSQPVSMQTLEADSLKIIRRDNIKLDAFGAVQDDLRDRGLSSFIELIWPLPGETLDTFRRGIGSLCERDAHTIISYSHLLLNNTPIYHNREKLGLVTRPAGGGVAEAQIVIATEQVSTDEFAEGMRYFYAVHAVHNTRSLRTTSKHLVGKGIVTYPELFSAFVDYWRTLPADDPIVDYVERSIRDALYYDVGNYGLFIHTVLHQHRALFTRHLYEFASSQPWWSDATARGLFEIDLINRPYVYSSTPLEQFDHPFETLTVTSQRGRAYQVELAASWHEALATGVRLDPAPPVGESFTVDHKRLQYPFMAGQSLDHNGNYCHGMIEKIENIVPFWRTAR
ncbi:hypothetical protein AMIS_49680 [Actinoplanes missouriensis 431]|uniref:B12-binding domain-containing protein n=1 Tax=Actinoplanes missouriensis (strain ATCC 14538 / DSM 43046 / CBS 188.64 / JCM 3121 / NBRC 102363 / NCIMB 12654 / NRRL B-3342 / UNCC 431) TaxID=512565 RepID=I0HB01_ACTM4|nr:hypothetical protein [Actinoplanes missouriensis]BAL90188.1 hypothetical protein AMIS_49680 [Actinoplanes missouriensis 431]